MSHFIGKRWYVVRTHVHGEAKAAQSLLRQGFGVYLPRYLKRRRHARKIDMVAAPLFPRYLFVGIELASQRWRSVHSTFGVSHLVMNGEGPAHVPNAVIESLRAREGDNGFIKLDCKPAFAHGDKVRVLTGAFVDSLGLFEGMGDRERVSILLDLLGRKVRVMLDDGAIAPA